MVRKGSSVRVRYSASSPDLDERPPPAHLEHAVRTTALLALPITAFAVTAPVGLANGVPHAFVTDAPRAEIAPLEARDGTYGVVAPLRSPSQPVHWFTAGPPPAMGSVPAPRLARLLARRASGDSTRAPLAHMTYDVDGRTAHFLATVASTAASTGPAKAAALRLTLTALRPEELRVLATGDGLLARTARRCLDTPAESPGAACTTPTPRANGRAAGVRPQQASRIAPGLPPGARATVLRGVIMRFIVTDPDGI